MCDAAMTADPLWAVGCGWALQSAEQLVDCTIDALQGNGKLDRALRRYRRRHRLKFGAFYLQSSSYSTGRKLLPHERLLLSSAAKDPAMARRYTEFAEGLIGLHQLLSPRSVGRALWVVATRRRSQDLLGASPTGPVDTAQQSLI
jgi:2-polyprenyl-6-methoxyphenol hydroxylase-like FAD-dependent oxidoreductase